MASMKIIKVKWLDAMSENYWISKEKTIENARKENIMIHHSVGFLLEKTPEYLLLIQSIGDSEEMVLASLQIPRRAILETKEIS